MVSRLSKSNIVNQLYEATSALLELARGKCWNKISDNTCFILSEIIHDGKNAFERRRYSKLNSVQKTFEEKGKHQSKSSLLKQI